jgi:4-amino-4-deoxy-L-arabinose transferase-like glycosyltransferase
MRTVNGNSNLKRATVPLLGFYCFIGLSLLAKGLVGVIILFGIIIVYFAVRRELLNRTFLRSLVWGIPLALVVAVLWYGPMIYRHGWFFLDQFFVQHHLARFVSNKYHHPQPAYFYLPILVLFVLPWTILLVATVNSSKRWSWRGSATIDRLRVFAFIWIAFPPIFFSFSASKLPGYILPVVPAVALLVGDRIDCFLRANRGDRVIRLTAVLLIAVAGGGAWFSVAIFGVPLSWAVAASLGILIVAGAAFLLPHHRVVWFLLFALTPCAMTVIALSPAQSIASRESVSDLMGLAASRGYANTPVVQLHTVERTAEFYAAGRLTYGSDGEPVKLEGAFQVAEAARRAGGVVLCLVPMEYASQLTSFPPVQGEIIGANGEVALVAVRAR